MPHRTDRIDRYAERTVSTVFKADREGQAAGQFAMELGFRGSRPNSAEGETIGQELWRDGIEHLARDWHAPIRQIDEQLPRYSQSLVDLEAVVDFRIVDQALPAYCCTGFLQVGAHDDEEVILVLLFQLQEACAVV